MTDPNATPVAPTAPAGAPAAVPGKTLGIVGLILSIFVAIVGLIVSIVALRQSKKAGYGNGPAVAGIVIGILGTIGWILFWALIGVGLVFAAQTCADLGPGQYVLENGAAITCG